MPPGRWPSEAGGADRDADDEIRADGARRLLADPADERGHAQRAEDQPDQAAERADHGAARSRRRGGSAPRAGAGVRARRGRSRSTPKTRRRDADHDPERVRRQVPGGIAAADGARPPKAAASRRRGASRPGRPGYERSSRRRPRARRRRCSRLPRPPGSCRRARRTGSRMLPRTSPSRPPASATRKHQTPTAARTSACTRLNMSHERANATSERVRAAGAGGGAARAEGPADRPRHGHGRRSRRPTCGTRRSTSACSAREKKRTRDAARARRGARRCCSRGSRASSG